MEVDLWEERTGRGHVRFGLLPAEHKEALPLSPTVLDALPKLLSYTRSPVFDTRWNFVAKRGYDPASQVYYDGPEVSVIEGTTTLDRLLADFCWKDDADRVNYIGMLLTALTVPNWPRHPMVVFNANKSQVGKTQLASAMATIVDGRHPMMVGYHPDDSEFEKVLGQQVDNGDRVIVIDNAKTGRHANMRKTGPEINSPVLERSVTQAQLNFRRLGKNDAPITCENTVIFALTVNHARLCEDIRNRTVPVNLFLEEGVRGRAFGLQGQPEDFALENRVTILGELAGLVTRFVAAGAVIADGTVDHTVNPAWAKFMASLLGFVGLPGFLSNFEASKHDFDLEYQTVKTIAELFWDAGPLGPSEWAGKLLNEGLVTGLKDHAGVAFGAIKLGCRMKAVFSPFVGQKFESLAGKVQLVERYDGHAKKSVFEFVRVVCG